jgi:hypothetical protein
MRSGEWLEHVSRAYAQAGQSLTQTLRSDLLAPETDSGDDPRFQQAFDLLTRYFFSMGTQGIAFGETRKGKERFGSSLEENYGLTSGRFLNLARTYWTFKIELDDLMAESEDYPLTEEILKRLEHNVASVFFPTPGPLQILVSERTAMRRQMLQAYAPGVDIDRFISENPILRGDIRAQSSGCFGVAISVVKFCLLISLYFLGLRRLKARAWAAVIALRP